MNDSVADRAAAHATQAELAVRDWLLAGLSFATGIYEAICFLTFGKVFTAAQTGNLVLLGIGVAGTRQPAGPNPVTVVISLAAFAAGAALATPILKAFDGDKETRDDKIFHAWPRRVTVALAVALILQVGFLAVWATAASPASLAYILMALILMALSALALGLQANTIRDLRMPGISTTAFTATFIDLFSGLATWSLTAHSARRLATTMVSMAAGAFLGDWMLNHAHRYAPVVPVAVTAVVIAIACVALKPRTSSPRPAYWQPRLSSALTCRVVPVAACELLAELTAAGPGSPVSAGTKDIQHLPDSRMPPGSGQVTA
jgi:uncharacterized membrane protein YoaK (UPF0700 family)